MGGNVDPSRSFEAGDTGVISYEGTPPISLVDVFELGHKLQFLRSAGFFPENTQIGKREEKQVLGTLTQIENILREREFETTVTGRVASFRNHIEGKYDESDDVLEAKDASTLFRNAETWIHLLKQDLQRERQIPASDIGILDVNRLIENPEGIFDEQVWNWLDDGPREDIKEACKALVVGCSTASVMLSLRAVEHCLRSWYEKENSPIEAGWGQVLDRMMEEYASEDARNDTMLSQLSHLPPVMSNLVYLKDKRNEVNHPDKSPDVFEAQRTLMVVVSTITDIHDEISEERMALLENSLQMDLEGVGQLNIAYFSNELNMEDVFYKAISEMSGNFDNGVPRSIIYEFGEHLEMSKGEVDAILTELMMSGRGYEPNDETIQLI